jgi:hypothetical protein
LYLFYFFNLLDFVEFNWKSFNFVINSCGLLNLLEVGVLFSKYNTFNFD